MKTVLALLLAVFCACAAAQAYPTKPIRLIIPFPPGGSNDVVGRAMGQQLSEKLGQGVVIDNRGGAGGVIGTNEAAKSPPDGYTLLLISTALPTSIAFNRLPQDIMKSFAPVSMLGSGPALLVVPANSPVNSVQDLLNLVQQKPGELNAAAAGIGSFQHMATELFRLQSKTNFVIVQYKGGGPALTDTIGGQVHFNLGSLVQMMPHVRSGKLKALAVASRKRVASLPGTPTLAESLPGFEAVAWFGIVGPPKTPAAIAEKVAAGVAEALKHPEVLRRLGEMAAEPMGLTPAETAAFMKQETERWGGVIRSANVRLE